VMHAMHEQMKAERNRRAVVLEADGAREAAITRAEGQKQSVILASEAVRQQAILEAEGEADAIRAVADAEAAAIRSVYGAIHDGDPTPDLLAVKYLEALGTVADGRATKIFLPADMSATLGSLGAIAELFTGDEPEGDGPETSAREAAPAEPEDLAG